MRDARAVNGVPRSKPKARTRAGRPVAPRGNQLTNVRPGIGYRESVKSFRGGPRRGFSFAHLSGRASSSQDAEGRPPMAYDDVKEFEGETYSGMAVGGEHTWLYPNGLWHETKVTPDKWEFTFASLKERERSAAAGSGVPVGTEYHWYVLAHQRVRKIDADTYTTFMSGLKYKVAHKRPHWRKWSSEYPEKPWERGKFTASLEETLEGRGGAHAPVGSPPVEPSRSPSSPRGPRTS